MSSLEGKGQFDFKKTLRSSDQKAMFPLVLLVSFSIQFAQAQVDPSSVTLLGESKSTPSAGLQSGRYEAVGAEVEPKEKPPSPRFEKSKPKTEVVSEAKVVAPKPARKVVPDANGIPTAVIQPKAHRWTASSEEVAKVESAKPETKSDEKPGFEAPVNENAPAVANEEEPKDSGAKVEIELLSGVAHEDAKSNTVYRNYSMTSPVAGFGGIVWVNEQMGFSGRYQTTLSADIGSATDGNSRVPVTAEWSELHWKFRRQFGEGLRAPTLEYGFLYFENSMKAPTDDPTRGSLKSSGFGADAKLLLPSSKTFSWIFGTAIYPRIRNAESPGASGFSAGSDPESSRFDFSWGADFRLASTNTVFWDLSLNLEKNQFGGTGNLNEPSGTPAQNVSILTSTVFFHLGYRWGR